MNDLGTLGGANSYARAINTAGEIVGDAQTASGERHAFLYSGGSMSDLGTLGGASSFAYGMNNLGQIVGHSAIVGGANRAFLYSDGTMNDLNTLIAQDSGWTLTFAFGVNDAGRIVGSGDIDGKEHAFLLTPVPEPSTSALMLLGVGTAWGVRRRKR